MLRFHLDENMDHAIAVGLRARGIDVTTTPDAGLGGASDEEQLAFTLREQSVIVSYDDDLLVLHAAGVAHAGIAYGTLRSRSIGQMILKLAALSRNYDPPDMFGRVEFL
jgi:predicted nuclease of predicted toxin-antitoxin system